MTQPEKAMTNESQQGKESKDSEGKYFGWYRMKDCYQCQGITKQLLHGHDEEGRLWKGHVCKCGGYVCTGCGRLEDKEAECCR